MLSQYLMLQTATDDAIVRVKNTVLSDHQEKFIQVYFSEQHHNSIIDFVQHHLNHHDASNRRLMIQVRS